MTRAIEKPHRTGIRPTEKRMLAMLRAHPLGLTAYEIARDLKVSEHTVRQGIVFLTGRGLVYRGDKRTSRRRRGATGMWQQAHVYYDNEGAPPVLPSIYYGDEGETHVNA